MRLPFVLAALLATGLAVVACDQAQTMGQAEVGDCYKVVGKDSLGAPKIEPAACAGEAPAVAQVPAAAKGEETELASAETPAGASGAPAACPAPTVTQVCCPQVVCPAVTEPKASTRSYVATSTVRPKVVAGKSTQRRRAAAASTTARRQTSSTREYEGLGIEYARVGEGVYEGYGRAYAPPPAYAAPPVYAPPVRQGAYGVNVDVQESQSGSYGQFSQSSGYAAAYGSGYASGGYGHVAAPAPCCAPARGPNLPFDRNGYLTWPGKVGG